MASGPFVTYASRIRALRRAHPDISEPALAPMFQRLIEDLLPTLLVPQGMEVVPEFQNASIGRPDIALKRAGQSPHAFIELKAPDKPANPTRWRIAHDKRQYARLQALPIWATSNFEQFCLLEREDVKAMVDIVPRRALEADISDTRADMLVADHDDLPFIELLTSLAITPPPSARNAEELAANLAYAARLVKAIIADRLTELKEQGLTGQPLQQVRAEFRDVLFAHPEAGGYKRFEDDLFAGAFAQTLAFGLLLVREGSGADIDIQAWQHMPAEHPLMRNALQVLTLPQITAEVGIGFDVMIDTVNGWTADAMAVRPDGRDPILYFYEDFLRVFDPVARERYGVYYTPVEVVRYMVGALDRALRDLGTAGLGDQNVTLLDPAVGTGTFLLGVAERVRLQAQAGGAGMDRLALHDLARRMYGFELLVGPYAVAHYRLHHALRETAQPNQPPPPPLPRLGVFLADTLARPGADAPVGQLGFVAGGIRDERLEANRIKTEQPILAIIGNPPYRRLEEGEDETLVGRWMNELWDDLRRPVQEANWGGELNTFPELSVAFWRWAMWKLFESENAPRRGVVAFITNRTFLTGRPYAGLRQMLRRRFDRIEIVDLRGDVRLGARAGVLGDGGVFNIQVGTAIVVATADGSRTDEDAIVTYRDSWAADRITKNSKLRWLNDGAENGLAEEHVTVDRLSLDDFKPEPFQEPSSISIDLCFATHGLGIQSKRDHLVYGFSDQDVSRKIQRFLSAPAAEAAEIGGFRSRADSDRARSYGLDANVLTRVAYRPLDVRTHYSSPRFNYSLRPALFAAFRQPNRVLYVLRRGTGAGPATWCHGLMPDYHAFRGSYGGYAFSCYTYDGDQRSSNLSPALMAGLNVSYGSIVTPEDVFDAILALLSATSYTLRFAEDLEDVFPHVPFPADPAVFARAVEVGRAIRAVETFARPPVDLDAVSQLITPPSAGPLAYQWDDGELTLRDDGSGTLAGIPQPVWDFAVSGYRVLPRWLAGREGQPVDLALVAAVRDLAARIAELLRLFDVADEVLHEALAGTLDREALGLGAVPVQDDEDDESD